MKFLFALVFLSSNLAYTQKSVIRATFFNRDTVARYTLFETGLNQPGGPDTNNCVIEIKKKGTIYSFQYITISPKPVEIYNSKTLKSIVFTFNINKNKEVEPLVNRDNLMIKLKGDLVSKFGKDTAAFGEYFFMMYNPDQMIQDKYIKYLDIMKNYFDMEIKIESKEIFIPSMAGPIPANFTNTYVLNNDAIIINNKIATDSNKVRAYLYSEMIRKYGESMVSSLKEKDMAYTPITITNNATGNKLKTEGTYFIKSIEYEHRHNQGNPFDIVEIIKIRQIDH